jgi:hypothetical protein
MLDKAPGSAHIGPPTQQTDGPDFPKQQRLNPSSARKKRQERGNALLE